MSKALLVVSYGSTLPAAQADIAALEAALAAAAPGYRLRRAVSSPKVRERLRENGGACHAPAPRQALELLLAEGVAEVAVLPTHLVPGTGYQALREEAGRFRGRFDRLRLGRPLLDDPASVQALARHIAGQWLPEQGALVLAGHGSGTAADRCYAALAGELRKAASGRVILGTLRGPGRLDGVLAALKAGGWRQVQLRPLTLAAGVHAWRELAGPAPQSWQSRLKAEGFAVTACLTGMARDPAVQALYLRQLHRLTDIG